MKKKRHIYDYKIVSLVVPIALLLLWQYAADHGLVAITVMPAPTKLYESLIKMIDKGTLQENILVSIRRVVFGYCIGASLGITLGVMTGLSKLTNRLLNFLLEILRPIPIMAWLPVIILWCGIGENTKVIAICIGSFWPIFLNTMDGVRNIDKKYLEVSRIFMKSKSETVFKVILPDALPGIFTGLRIGVGSAWLSVVGAEMVAASAGLGFLISYSREMMQPANMFVGVFAIGIIGLIINTLIRKLESKALKWNVNTNTRK
jgi:ABC-type nitrate/sulfonate/bicarbonate transport system, permease component